MVKTRSAKAARNVFLDITAQISTYIMTFMVRTVFIRYLDAAYLGINGVLLNIINILSLSELGFTTALSVSLYKPLKENDNELIASILKFFNKVYFVVVLIILFIGSGIIPFLPQLINTDLKLNLYVVFVLYILSSIVTYFAASYSTLIMAAQKGYLLSGVKIVRAVILSVLQLAALIVFESFYFYTISMIIANMIEAFGYYYIYTKKFTEIAKIKAQKLSDTVKKDIYRKSKASLFHKFGGVVLTSTDNLIISYFISVSVVGYYSNYTLIIGILNTFLTLISNSLSSFVGEAGTQKDKSDITDIYWKINYFNCMGTVFCCICLLCLCNPFIEIWAGAEYVLPEKFLLVLSVQFYINGIRRTTQLFNMTLGLYEKYQFFPFIEAAMNLLISIVLVKYIGITGVLLGTIISVICVTFWKERQVLHRNAIIWKKKDNLFDLKAIGIFISGAGISKMFLNVAGPDGSVFSFLWYSIIIILFASIFIYLCSRMDEYGKWWVHYLEEIFKR